METVSAANAKANAFDRDNPCRKSGKMLNEYPKIKASTIDRAIEAAL